MSEEAALANIAMNNAALFPEGRLREGIFLFRVMSDNQHVGDLWIARQTGAPRPISLLTLRYSSSIGAKVSVG
jgi:hypothetical protein